jgi:hypothetical protein
MASFAIPDHIEVYTCNSVQTNGKICTTKPKYRYFNRFTVKYCCGRHNASVMRDTPDISNHFKQIKVGNLWATVKKSSGSDEQPSQSHQPPSQSQQKYTDKYTEELRIYSERVYKQLQQLEVEKLKQHFEAEKKEIELKHLVSKYQNLYQISNTQKIKYQNLYNASSKNKQSTNDDDKLLEKVQKSTQLSINKVSKLPVEQKKNAMKQLKFQLHPDKHPDELSWLFTEMFKLVNV